MQTLYLKDGTTYQLFESTGKTEYEDFADFIEEKLGKDCACIVKDLIYQTDLEGYAEQLQEYHSDITEILEQLKTISENACDLKKHEIVKDINDVISDINNMI